MPWRYPRQLGTLSWTQQEYYFHGGNFSFVWGLSCVLGSLVASEHSTYPLLATWAYNGLPLPSGVAHEHMSCVATLHFATSHTSEERYSKAHWRTGNNCREDWTHSPTSSHTGVFVTRLFQKPSLQTTLHWTKLKHCKFTQGWQHKEQLVWQRTCIILTWVWLLANKRVCSCGSNHF